MILKTIEAINGVYLSVQSEISVKEDDVVIIGNDHDLVESFAVEGLDNDGVSFLVLAASVFAQ